MQGLPGNAEQFGSLALVVVGQAQGFCYGMLGQFLKSWEMSVEP
jgi:hypothetical protein